VVGALLDCEAPDDFVNNLILSVRSLLPVDALVEQVEKRNRCGAKGLMALLVSPGCRLPRDKAGVHVSALAQPPPTAQPALFT
jgi:hypothetical protein